MPKFSQADEAFLKRTMLPRAPACFFTAEDVELVVKETGMQKEVILHWAANLRWKKSSSGLIGNMNVNEFLKASAESLNGKVMSATNPSLSHTRNSNSEHVMKPL